MTRYVSLGSVSGDGDAAAARVRDRQSGAGRRRPACAAAALIVFRHRSNLAGCSPAPSGASGGRRPRDRDDAMTACDAWRTGAGSWGTALAVHLARVGHDVRLWARDAALADEIAVAARERGLPAGRRRCRTASL